ncbi:Tiny macrocysts protein B [Tetrabaena socialis]|uniref:Tiny macrocysts protein B n=1 Tax=Tetrabaena socialis TaxID=47790 RepID=A0A2J7ZMU0_9CHLO|nr:Tiny macrocysts protein B [Tetrabaena socialis]|eukprot:PNH01578.1 Tiny macrocysts protein B [Tetrabaena socialis]
MSGSSVSSLGSSNGGGSNFNLNTVAPGEDGELFDQSNWVFKFFSVLYTIGKERPLTGPRYAFVRIFLNGLQLWLLAVVPHYGWDIPADNTLWKIVSFQRLGEFLDSRGYSFYLGCLYTFVALLFLCVVLSGWLAYCVASNRTVHSVVVSALRWYGVIFTQVMYVTSLTLLLLALDCNYFDVPADEQFTNRIFPEKKCWHMPHLVQLGISVASMIVFVFIALSLLVSEMELNPLPAARCRSDAFQRPSPRAGLPPAAEGVGFCLITLATIASALVTSVKMLSIVYFVLFLALNYITVKWVPFIHHWLNYARCGSYAAVLYSSALLVVLSFSGASSHARTHGHQATKDSKIEDLAKAITICLWAGQGPAFIVGAFACHLRLRFFNRTVVGGFRDDDSSGAATSARPGKLAYKFKDSREVEIAARCARRWLDEDTVDPEAMQLSEAIIKAGMVQMPNDALMIIIYSSFLIDVQGSYQSGYAQLQGAKQRQPGPLERFAIYQREQDHSARGASATGGTVDLVSYVEFQRNHRLVSRAHKDALITIRAFWGLLLHGNVHISKVERALQRIEVSIKLAERAYRGVLSRHSNNARLVRLYANFLETVKFDPWAASKWFAEAERLDEQAEHAKEAMQLGGLELGMLPRDAATAAARLLTNADGVMHMFINAQGAIQLASPEVHALLGFSKNELKGKDVGVIMPPPFGDRHTAYVRNYINTGVSSLLDRPTEFVALTKNRSVCPIRLTVTKVTGLSEDSVFMGVMEVGRAGGMGCRTMAGLTG